MSITRTFALAVAATLAVATTAAAQPSDRQVKKDLTSKNVKSIKLPGKGSAVELNPDTLVYEYSRYAELTEPTEWKGIKVIVTGFAVYQKVGRAWRYWKFRVAANRYDGIPNPTAADIDAVLDTDRAKQFGEGAANTIVKVIEAPALAADPKWNWESPTLVSFEMTGKVEAVVSYTETEVQDLVLEVRLYRDRIDGPWTGFLATPTTRTAGARTKHTADEVRAMPNLVQQAAEDRARTLAASRPAVELPAFASAEELARYVHKTLREGPRETADAVLRALAAPRLYATGSTVLLSTEGEQIVTNAVTYAFAPSASYALEYCASPTLDTRGTKTRFYVKGVKDNMVTEIVAVQAGGTLKDGVEVGATWMLDDVRVRTRDDADTLAWIKSYSDRSKLCPND